MSEQEPRREPVRYNIEFQGEKYMLGPDNTLIYSHRSDKKYDHIYVQFPAEEDEEERGAYLWRLDPKYTQNFEMMVSNLLSINVTMITHNDVSEFDLKQWRARFGNTPTAPQNAPGKELAPTLTQRQINRAQFFGYLPLHDNITPMILS